MNSDYKSQFIQLLRSQDTDQFQLALMIAQGIPTLSDYLDRCIAIRTIQIFRHQKPTINQNIEMPVKEGFNLNVKILSSKQITHLLPGIRHLHSVKFLNLSFNRLTEIPPEIGELQNLQTLKLSYNNLQDLPEEIRQLSQLENLWLMWNPINSLEQEKIKSWLPNCKIIF